jgi:hypothetical protein
MKALSTQQNIQKIYKKHSVIWRKQTENIPSVSDAMSTSAVSNDCSTGEDKSMKFESSSLDWAVLLLSDDFPASEKL